MAALARTGAVLILSLPLVGCYLMQAASGQMAIASGREPISAVLADAGTPQRLRERLEYVTAARDFASGELGLPDNESYRSYVDVGRSYVLWNVFATEEFSVEPRRWCFPIAGCVVYRGYFDQDNARRYANHLRRRGGDAAVAGVAAYSTLGHFNDPVLNTMMGWSDARLAATLFHELAHQVVYVAGDSEFNESFATVVEEASIERWLASRGQSQELRAWHLRRKRADQFVALLLRTRERLRELYASGLPAEQMRDRKQYEFGALKLRYMQLKREGHGYDGYDGYDGWFDRTLNNAHLVSAATYYGCVTGLQRLLSSVGGDLPTFYEKARQLAQAEGVRREVCGGEERLAVDG